MNDHLIVALNLAGRSCVVVGSSSEADKRALALLECGAKLRLVRESLSGELAGRHAHSEFDWRSTPFVDSDIDGAWLVILADRDPELARRVQIAAESRRCFYCALDQPSFSSFSHLALMRSADVTIAISTFGRVPALASRLREELERIFSQANFPAFFEALARLRQELPARERRTRLKRILDGLHFSGELELPPLHEH